MSKEKIREIALDLIIEKFVGSTHDLDEAKSEASYQFNADAEEDDEYLEDYGYTAEEAYDAQFICEDFTNDEIIEWLKKEVDENEHDRDVKALKLLGYDLNNG